MDKTVVAGIVAEYNPFHKGHAWMMHQLRRGGIGAVVCVLSGPFVQRAEPALLPTWLRARAAVAGGADLVLRLPVHWATASAERFATGGAGLLAALGIVDVLAFGAETADVDKLAEIAFLLTSDEFSAALKKQLAGGRSFAAARAAAAEQVQPGAGAILAQPNNILGIEYCKALQGIVPAALDVLRGGETPTFMQPVPLALPRVGAAHDGDPRRGVASASWLREQYFEKGVEALQEWVPPVCYPLYKQATADGDVIDPARWEMALLARLRGQNTAAWQNLPDAGEGLATRLAAAAKQATSLSQLYAAAKTKRFAHSRVRRLALHAALGPGAQHTPLPPFAQVLAANATGLGLLKRAKQHSLVPLSTSLAKLSKTHAPTAPFATAEAAAEDLYALCQRRPAPGGQAYNRPAWFSL